MVHHLLSYIQQWTYTTNIPTDSIKVVTIPIAFTKWYIIISCSDSMSVGSAVQQAGVGAMKIDLSKFKVSNDNGVQNITSFLLGV